MNDFGVGGIEAYQRPWDRLMTAIANWPMSEKIREVADVIYTAATDGTEQLRYPAGQEAIHILEARAQMDDISFKKMMVAQLGIEG